MQFASRLNSGLVIMLMNYLSRQLRKNMLKGIMVEQHVNMRKLIVFGGIIIVLTPSGTRKELMITT
jgi:hypothetical protein